MAQYRPFAIWDGESTLPSGIAQNQNILIGESDQEYYNLGGFDWWAGPDESLGYVIAYYDPTFTHPNPLNIPCGIGFLRSAELTDASFLSKANQLRKGQSLSNLSNANDAKAWLLTNGYWTSYGVPAWTYGNSVSNQQPSNPTSGLTITVQQSGSNLLFTATGSLNINGLTFNSTTNLGGGGIGPGTGTWIMGANANMDIYSGITTSGIVLGTNPGGAPFDSVFGDIIGVIYQSQPPYQLAVPSGYNSGEAISANGTILNQTFSSFGLTEGTYTYSWGSGANAESINFIIGGTTTNTGGSGNSGGSNTGSGSGDWYFYSDEGTINTTPPLQSGQLIITGNTDNGTSETYNPNYEPDDETIWNKFVAINLANSGGTSLATEFNNLMVNGGTISLTQNGQVSTYSTNQPGAFFVDTQNGFFVIPVSLQTTSTDGPFVYGDPISISFGGGATGTKHYWTAGDPSQQGQLSISANNSNQLELTTNIFVSKFAKDSNGNGATDISAFISGLSIGDDIVLKSTSASSNSATYNITSIGQFGSNGFNLGVSHISGSGYMHLTLWEIEFI